MHGALYVYDEREVREALEDELLGNKLGKPTDEDVDACLEYMYDRFAELFYESISDFVDENYDRFEEGE